MVKGLMTSGEVMALLRHKQGSRTNSAFAAELGISKVYLGDIYNGNRAIGGSVLAALGLKREIMYRKVA